MSALLMLLALQAPAPLGPRTVPIAGTEWRCTLADPQWRQFKLQGRFEEFRVDWRPDYGEDGSDAVVEADSSNRFVGTHKVYVISAASAASGIYTLIVRESDETYYHFMFHFYGEGELGSVTIEQQKLAGKASRFSAVGAGFCEAKPLIERGKSR